MLKRLVTTAAVFMVAAPTAFAGSSQSGYAGKAGAVQGTVQKSGSLPFTGLSLTAFAIVGALLIVTGVFLHRRTAHSED
ncbi:MAG TPA: hypothetical protein VFI04_04265 [Gaiellaceae bacterium]|jgi:hypothetical protein|nr:hypothetical protein [Gaiellaceae bacterium]